MRIVSEKPDGGGAGPAGEFPFGFGRKSVTIGVEVAGQFRSIDMMSGRFFLTLTQLITERDRIRQRNVVDCCRI